MIRFWCFVVGAGYIAIGRFDDAADHTRGFPLHCFQLFGILQYKAILFIKTFNLLVNLFLEYFTVCNETSYIRLVVVHLIMCQFRNS